MTAVRGGWQAIHLYGAMFAGSVAFFCLHTLIADWTGPGPDLVAIAGGATCGWSWLLTRSLFHRADLTRPPWPLVLVILLIGLIAILQWMGEAGPLRQMGHNALGLLSSTALLLALVEPMRGYRRDMAPGERRFRITFTAVYATVMTVSVIGIGGAPEGSLAAQWGDQIKMICALLALAGGGLAIHYRSRNPLPEAVQARRRVVSDDDRLLAERILRLMRDENLHAQTHMKVGDLARRLGEAEYKVSQSITGALGFRNFNHMVNQFRIERAQAMLSDRRYDHLPVLTIALDCGFGSIGPFNRAFKVQCDATPTAFREARRAD